GSILRNLTLAREATAAAGRGSARDAAAAADLRGRLYAAAAAAAALRGLLYSRRGDAGPARARTRRSPARSYSSGFTSVHGERPSSEYAKIRKESLESGNPVWKNLRVKFMTAVC
ncbi:hypothetical protein EJB05_35256, partial [Eragrostis curvula]